MYYVSLLWSILLIYSLVKLVHHRSPGPKYRVAAYCVLGVVLVVWLIIKSGNMMNPISCSVFFFAGGVAAYLLKRWTQQTDSSPLLGLWFSKYNCLRASRSLGGRVRLEMNDSDEEGIEDRDSLSPDSPKEKVSLLTGAPPPAITRSNGGTSLPVFVTTVMSYLRKHTPDALVALFLFLLFYQGYPHEPAFSYHAFDQFVFRILGPLLFTLILLTCLMQAPGSGRSYFTRLCESSIMVVLGMYTLYYYT